jgi:DNA invertase Pin-like site-specific DNA recombinase
MMGVFAELERAMVVERVKSGLERAKAQGKRLGGRRNDDPKRVAAVKRLRAEGIGINRIAREVECGVSHVQRVLAGN